MGLVEESPMFVGCCKTTIACGDMEIKEGWICKDGCVTIPAVLVVFVSDVAVDICSCRAGVVELANVSVVVLEGLVPSTEQAD